MSTYLVTGAAGFIGYHLTRRLLDRGVHVVGFDNLNDYYSVSLKQDRLAQLLSHDHFTMVEADLADQSAVDGVFAKHDFDRVVHLAAQAGVRYSLENPRAYAQSNLVGFVNILEACRHAQTPHLTYASSSSVYGGGTQMPFATDARVDHPYSLYAATKKSNELMAHSYSHLYGLPTTGLRFFTVYGPWGRPDMALFLFTKAILEGRPIDVFNGGKMRRDFTYIDDIVEGVDRTSQQIAKPDPNFDPGNPNPATSAAPYQLYNIGNNEPVELGHFIEVIEDALGIKAQKNLLPMQPGDVPATYADINALESAVGFRPATSIEVGVKKFVDWYRDYYAI
ncbi:UDP-glucose 4-epimerase [Rubripirellula lacrimiformis]|uniref:UDP-glucose 4-epimerase n=1 Tax=Rubripirellula lacrimiformis TaxID=1930273 RepID=A0A517N477_9BACT|nr:NAD-dependent epimerase [Rubripirellula lacrimiformis]QDT01922.1 UDP-glucose 4-epimerase [Rubripirellula lacrimiformis]